MDHVTLGDSGLQVSRACLGTMNFATEAAARHLPGPDETEAGAIIDAFLADGHNFIDTADVYTGGQSEEVVGRAIRGRRDSVVLAGKAGGPTGRHRSATGLSRRHLTRALHDSLRRLGTDYIDLYQCHLWDPMTPIEETMATLDDFVRAGKVRYLGCSNFTAAQIVESQWAAQRGGGSRFISLQPQYSLLNRQIEAEVLPTAARHGLGTLIYSPLGGGVLSGRYRRGAEPGADTRLSALKAVPNPNAAAWAAQLLSDRSFDIVDAVGEVAAELGAEHSAVAIAWAIGRPHITSAIVGPRTLDQYRQVAVGFGLELPASARRHLDEVSAPDNLPVNGAPNAGARA